MPSRIPEPPPPPLPASPQRARHDLRLHWHHPQTCLPVAAYARPSPHPRVREILLGGRSIGSRTAEEALAQTAPKSRACGARAPGICERAVSCSAPLLLRPDQSLSSMRLSVPTPQRRFLLPTASPPPRLHLSRPPRLPVANMSAPQNYRPSENQSEQVQRAPGASRRDGSRCLAPRLRICQDLRLPA